MQYGYTQRYIMITTVIFSVHPISMTCVWIWCQQFMWTTTIAVLWLSNHQALPSAFWTIFATQSLHIRQMCWWVCQMIQTKFVCFQMWQISIVLEGLEFPDMSLGNQVSQVCMDDEIGCNANFWHNLQWVRYRCLRLQGQIFRQETFFRMSGYLMPAAKQIVTTEISQIFWAKFCIWHFFLLFCCLNVPFRYLLVHHIMRRKTWRSPWLDIGFLEVTKI